MIIFTAGYPSSGKTEFATLLAQQLSSHKVVHIDPAKLRLPEYDSFTPDGQTQARIAAWEVAQDILNESLKEPNSTIIIFDTCAAKAKSMMPHFANAKVNKHDVVYTFIAASISECKKRAGTKWPSNEVINNYGKEFVESVPKLREASSKFFFVKNNDDPNRLSLKDAINKIAKAISNGEISGIRKPKPIRSSINRPRQKDNKRTKVQPHRPV